MRLALVREDYPPFGVDEQFIEASLEALLERNVAISLYTRQWPQTRLQLIEPVVCNPFYLGRLMRDWGFARVVCRIIGRCNADLVESFELIPCCDIYRAREGVHAVALEELARAGPAWLVVMRRLSPWHRHRLTLERRMYASRWLRVVICRSRMVKDEIRERFGVPEERLHVVYDPVDADRFHPGLRSLRGWVRERSRISDSATLFLLVGSDYRKQGVPAAIAALALLPPTTHLMIIGADSHVPRYHQLARQHGITQRVTFVGPQAERKPYYGAADVLLMPALYDPGSEVALEAMACGLPVIASTKSGAAELVRDHDAGLVCDALDINGIAAHMRALQDEVMRARLGANARTAAVRLSPAAATLQLVLLYRDLLSTPTGARGPNASGVGSPGVTSKDVRTWKPSPGAPVTQHSAMDLVRRPATLPSVPAHASSSAPGGDDGPPPPVLQSRVAPEALREGPPTTVDIAGGGMDRDDAAGADRIPATGVDHHRVDTVGLREAQRVNHSAEGEDHQGSEGVDRVRAGRDGI